MVKGLGRIVVFDDRSKNHPVKILFGSAPLKTTYWECPVVLDQGKEGACVGFAWSHSLAANPHPSSDVTNDTGFSVYNAAKRLDDWPGEDYSGTSVLAGVKALKKQFPGKFSSYKWAFGLWDVIRTISDLGPVTLGIPWYRSFYRPGPSNILALDGPVVGGHAILANGVDIDRGLVQLHNSWGVAWGNKGNAFVTFDTLDKLLKQQGEACFLVGKQ